MARPKRFLWPVTAAACITAGAFFATLVGPEFTGGLTARAADTPAAQTAQTAQPTKPVNKEAVSPLNQLSAAFRAVHNSLENAVVNIQTTEIKAPSAESQGQIPDDLRKNLPPGLAPFFNLPGPGGAPQKERLEGTGSGVIVSPDGYILTNNHVVDGAQTITVVLNDGRQLPGKVVGTDPKTDLAVIRIDAKNLTYARLGDSDKVQVGDWVLAFGSPFGFEKSMTQGIISAEHRQVNIIAEHNPTLAGLTYEDFLQTDAAINPGNSGGPLVDLNGDVIGINAAIASRTGAYNGIGFSIPSNEAKYVMDSLIKNGKVVRGYLGVEISDVRQSMQTRRVAESFGYKGDTGVLVENVRPGSPGANGGLKAGDVITELNGKTVESIRQLRTEVARTAPGTNVTLSVFRNGDTKTLSFPVGTQPATVETIASGNDDQGSNGQTATANEKKLGFSVAGITPEIANRLNLTSQQGVVVTGVDPDGVAADAGIAPGDVIVSIVDQPINSMEDFNKAVAAHPLNKGIRMTIRDARGSERFVFLQAQGNQ